MAWLAQVGCRSLLVIAMVSLLLMATAAAQVHQTENTTVVLTGRRLRQRLTGGTASWTSPESKAPAAYASQLAPLAPGISVTYSESEGYKGQEGQDK